MESQGDALNQLLSDELKGKFALLETSSVDDDLASLKKELSGTTKGTLCAASRDDVIHKLFTDLAYKYK
ncbi:hypothetical protein BUALT_Bualt03G0227900 [Buddleja alternifolia]|uniref:Arginine kinase n=1 Tax=Buddleja alternifolia TaxID=168488 RepID=A0AAV6XWQ7_9LAMI|nr:hypothetical protein BUALT_Bualt03G0227900 [Buddleja alternifolia]